MFERVFEPAWLPTADGLVLPEPPDLTFEGFAPEAFAILDRLRAHPHVEQYRTEKAGVKAHLTEPFKRFRDDLVVNFVLPNGLGFETEKNVFSRLLKNDFGAGGCHHHLWMAFYRPSRRRLTDVQLSHSITPDGFETGLFVGGYATDLMRQVRTRIFAEPDRFRTLLRPLQRYSAHYRVGTGQERTRRRLDAPLASLPEDLKKADALWLRRAFPRADVLAWQGLLVRHALHAVRDLWPIYRFFVEGT